MKEQRGEANRGDDGAKEKGRTSGAYVRVSSEAISKSLFPFTLLGFILGMNVDLSVELKRELYHM